MSGADAVSANGLRGGDLISKPDIRHGCDGDDARAVTINGHQDGGPVLMAGTRHACDSCGRPVDRDEPLWRIHARTGEYMTKSNGHFYPINAGRMICGDCAHRSLPLKRENRCAGCGQRLGIDYLTCFDTECEKTARNARRRVTPTPRTCDGCGIEFTPSRAFTAAGPAHCHRTRRAFPAAEK